MNGIHHILITALLALAFSGCGPTLVQQQEFTPSVVRDVKFSDTCQLQPYFAANPPALFKKSEVLVGADNKKKTFGRITFEIRPGTQAKTFYRLMDSTYRRVPKLDRSSTALATVSFLQRKGQTQMPIGAEVQLEVGKEEVVLPYSPCMGAFFFGRGYYRMRQRLLNPTAAPAAKQVEVSQNGHK